MTQLLLSAYEPAAADEATLRGAFALLEAEDAELRPEDPPFSWDEFAGLERRPEVASIDTENAFSNAFMLAIDLDMGFEQLRTINGWSAPVATLRARLEATA